MIDFRDRQRGAARAAQRVVRPFDNFSGSLGSMLL